MEDHYAAVIVPVGEMANADKLWREFDSMHLPAENFSVPLVPADGPLDADPTHYGLGAFVDADRAAIWLALPTNGGTLPEFTVNGSNTGWPSYGLTEQEAQDAAASLTVSVMTGGVPAQHFASTISGIALKRYEEA